MQFEVDPVKMKHGIDALKKVQKYIPEAVIAGGYVRDYIFGTKFKDIDIFFPHLETEVVDVVMQQLDANEMHGANYMPQSEITRIWNMHELSNWSFTEIQNIMLAPNLKLEDRIPLYDFGICQCWFDGTSIHTTEAFDNDFLNNTLTLTYCEDEVQFRRSMKRAERFLKKFPQLVLKIAPDLQEKVNIWNSVLTVQFS